MKNIKLIGRVGVRNSLVVFQFTISLFLFTALAIIYSQYNYSVNKDLGFDKDNMLIVNMQGPVSEPFLNKLQEFSDVRSVSLSSNIAGATSVNRSKIRYHEGADSLYISVISAEPMYIRQLGFGFLAGRNFADSAVSRSFVVVNEKFLPLLNAETPVDALGKTLELDGDQKIVVGVVKDFNYAQLENPIEPFLFEYNPDRFRFINIKLTGANLLQVGPAIEQAWDDIHPDKPFIGAFYDWHIQETYSFYVKLMRVFGYVGMVAMAIAILGLLGMTAYSTERRTKEIGIRKVLGARVSQILMLLSRGFVSLLFISALIALPGVYLLFDQVVLNLGAYRITIGLIEMSSGLIIMLLVGGAAIFSQTLKVSLSNPVDSLRTE